MRPASWSSFTLMLAGLGCSRLPTPSPAPQQVSPTFTDAEARELQVFFSDLRYATLMSQTQGVYLFRSGERYFAATYSHLSPEGNLLAWINQAREEASRHVHALPCPKANLEWSVEPCDLLIGSRDFPIAFVFAARPAIYATR
jgi:hypothetical protein